MESATQQHASNPHMSESNLSGDRACRSGFWGQGMNMALEDAEVLADLMAEAEAGAGAAGDWVGAALVSPLRNSSACASLSLVTVARRDSSS